MSEYVHKSHNVSVLLYHLVFPAKYRRAVLDEQVDEVLREVCLEIEKRYEIKFVEIRVWQRFDTVGESEKEKRIPWDPYFRVNSGFKVSNQMILDRIKF